MRRFLVFFIVLEIYGLNLTLERNLILKIIQMFGAFATLFFFHSLLTTLCFYTMDFSRNLKPWQRIQLKCQQ